MGNPEFRREPFPFRGKEAESLHSTAHDSSIEDLPHTNINESQIIAPSVDSVNNDSVLNSPILQLSSEVRDNEAQLETEVEKSWMNKPNFSEMADAYIKWQRSGIAAPLSRREFHILKTDTLLRFQDLAVRYSDPQETFQLNLSGDPEEQGYLRIYREFVSREISKKQRDTAEVQAYLALVDDIQPLAVQYSQRKNREYDWSPGKGKRMEDKIARAAYALEELYRIGDDTELLRDFRLQQEDASVFEDMLREIRPEMDKKREEIMASAGNITRSDQIRVIKDAAGALAGMQSNQRMEILSKLGYSKDELFQIIQKLGISLGLSVGLGAAIETAGQAVGIAGAAFAPVLDRAVDPKTLIGLAGSYAAYWAAMWASARENAKILENPDVRTSSSISATMTYYLLHKIMGEDGAALQKAVIGGSLAWAFTTQEATWMLGAFVNPNYTFWGNMLGAGANAILALGTLGVNRWTRSRRFLRERDSIVSATEVTEDDATVHESYENRSTNN